MGYNKITNLLGKMTKDEIPKCTTVKWMEIFDQPDGTYNPNKDIRFKTPQLRSALRDFNDAYIVATGKVNTKNALFPALADVPNGANYSRKLALKQFCSFL